MSGTQRDGPPELARIRAGDRTEFQASRATLVQSDYFRAKLKRWMGEAIELETDSDSLRVILRLLKYGPEAVPSLEPPLLGMVLKDADYFGVPPAMWKHLAVTAVGAATAEDPIERFAGRVIHCRKCTQCAVRYFWSCISCGRRVKGEPSPTKSTGSPDWLRAHDCSACGIEFAKLQSRCAVCGAEAAPYF